MPRTRSVLITALVVVSVLLVVRPPSVGASSRSHVVVAQRNDLKSATLKVVSGATRVNVTAAAPAGDLYRISTPSGSGVRPLVRHRRGALLVSLVGDGASHQTVAVAIALSSDVAWRLDLAAGATTETVRLRRSLLADLTFSAGVSVASVALPPPHGTLTVTLAGGATRLSLSAPTGPPAQVTAGGGASSVSFDGTVHHGIAGGTRFQDPGWPTAVDRYAIDLPSGVSTFSLARRGSATGVAEVAIKSASRPCAECLAVTGVWQ